MTEYFAYRDESLDFEERARDLVSRMTLEEVVTQMIYNSPAIPRLGIPYYNWWNEALHGVARAGVATVFPQAIGMAATFDEELVYRVAEVVSTEGRAKHHESQRKGDRGQYKGLTFWSPNVNIFRDPRWGRGHETYGEDPWLTGRLGVAYIKGLQGEGKYLKAAACAKHFAVHSGPESERHSFDAEVSKKDLHETYLAAFRACVTEGGVEAVMGAYNRVNGEPCCGSKTLLQETLRGKWGFQGHVTSDCLAIKDFHEGHMVTSTAPESVALAVNNGCDLNCGNMYLNLLIAHQEGLVSEETIRESAARLFHTRMKLGMFDDPAHVPYASIPYEQNNCREHRELALEVAKRSMVLLKNEGGILPLDKSALKTLAVIGPNANSRDAIMGNYFGTPSRYITVLEGIQDYLGDTMDVLYAQGCHLFRDRMEPWGAEADDRMAEAVSAAERADAVVLCLGLDTSIEGEEGDVCNEYAKGDKLSLNLPGRQLALMEAVHTVGKPVVLVLLSGSALAVGWADEHIPAIVQAWYPGAEGGRAVAALLFGEYSPSGRLPVTFYQTTEELPDFRDYSMRNRTYRYMAGEALYPFGFGLSYTRFEYGEIELKGDTLSVGEAARCRVGVRNAGAYEGYETVQLYLKCVGAGADMPRWQLKGVRVVRLSPGETAQIEFYIRPEDMALFDGEGNCVLEPGRFEVYIGGSQPDDRSQELTGMRVHKATFDVKGNTLIFRQ